MEKEIKTNVDKIIEFHKRFSKGEQYLRLVSKLNIQDLKEEYEIFEEPKQFYWQEREVYNHILPLIESAKSKNTKLTEDQIYGVNGLVAQLVPYQRKYNDIKNRKYEFINRVCCSNIIVEDGSIDIDNLEEEGLAPGKMLIYRQGSTPPQTLKQDYYIYDILGNELCQILTEMELIVNAFKEGLI